MDTKETWGFYTIKIYENMQVSYPMIAFTSTFARAHICSYEGTDLIDLYQLIHLLINDKKLTHNIPCRLSSTPPEQVKSRGYSASSACCVMILNHA